MTLKKQKNDVFLLGLVQNVIGTKKSNKYDTKVDTIIKNFVSVIPLNQQSLASIEQVLKQEKIGQKEKFYLDNINQVKSKLKNKWAQLAANEKINKSNIQYIKEYFPKMSAIQQSLVFKNLKEYKKEIVNSKEMKQVPELTLCLKEARSGSLGRLEKYINKNSIFSSNDIVRIVNYFFDNGVKIDSKYEALVRGFIVKTSNQFNYSQIYRRKNFIREKILSLDDADYNTFITNKIKDYHNSTRDYSDKLTNAEIYEDILDFLFFEVGVEMVIASVRHGHDFSSYDKQYDHTFKWVEYKQFERFWDRMEAIIGQSNRMAKKLERLGLYDTKTKTLTMSYTPTLDKVLKKELLYDDYIDFGFEEVKEKFQHFAQVYQDKRVLGKLKVNSPEAIVPKIKFKI